MSAQQQISNYINTQSEAKRSDMQAVHALTLRAMPKCKLSFFDGKNSDGKVVSNPTIGYGSFMMHYADGSTKESFRIGLSANTTGISVYVMGLADKTYLPNTFGKKIGKATVTGYCIRFKKLADIDQDILEAAIRYGAEQDAPK